MTREKPASLLATVLCSIVLALPAVVILVLATAPEADSTPGDQLYGGCAEAWQAPYSPGADDCRDLGWTIRKRIILNPHGVIRYWDLPTCGPSSLPPCGWLDSGRGVSYATTVHRIDYLWTPSPLLYHPYRTWVSTEQADALAEGSSPGATTREWTHCWTRIDDGQTVVCPDGHREQS